MHLGDSIFIFILALVLFGPKKLPEMARQIGKLMAEFRRASNDFRLQIDEELRTMERQEQLKKQDAERAAAPVSPILTATTDTSGGEPNLLPAAVAPQILPPAIGKQVSAGTPYAVSASTGEISTADEGHPLLRVDTIPPYSNEDPHANGTAPTGIAAAEANAARLAEHAPAGEPALEPEQAATFGNG